MSDATAIEKAYMGRVQALGCYVCLHCLGIPETPALVHHVRTGQGRMRASHYDTLPLCPIHHDFYPKSLHVLGVKRFPLVWQISEIQLLEMVHVELYKFLPSGHVAPRDPYAVDGPAIRRLLSYEPLEF